MRSKSTIRLEANRPIEGEGGDLNKYVDYSLAGDYWNYSDPITGDTPLHKAVKSSDIRAIQKLSDNNIVIKTKHNGGGYTPLHIAVKQSNPEIIEML